RRAVPRGARRPPPHAPVLAARDEPPLTVHDHVLGPLAAGQPQHLDVVQRRLIRRPHALERRRLRAFRPGRLDHPPHLPSALAHRSLLPSSLRTFCDLVTLLRPPELG